jgi:ABC-type transporter Mla subunit MlaD
VENKPTRRSKKIHTATAGMLCLATLTTGACVTRSTYDVAVADLEATKAELDSTHIQSQVLTEQVSQLQQLKIDLASQLETATSAVQRAKQKMEAEHTASQKWLSTLHRMIRQLAAQQNSLQYARQRANGARPPLQSLVEQYRSKLGEAGEPGAPLSTPQVERTDQPAKTALAPPGQVAAQANPAPNPTVTTPAASADPTAANPTPQPANKPTSKPVEENWLSMLKRWIISIWRSIVSPAE